MPKRRRRASIQTRAKNYAKRHHCSYEHALAHLKGKTRKKTTRRRRKK